MEKRGEERMCAQNRGAKDSLVRIKGPVDIGSHKFILVPIIPIHTAWFSPWVRGSAGPPIDGMKCWIDPGWDFCQTGAPEGQLNQ